VFASERGAPFTTAGFPRGRAGAAAARLSFKAHPHMRHACGYALANKGHDTRALQAYLGHVTSYTELSRGAIREFLAGVMHAGTSAKVSSHFMSRSLPCIEEARLKTTPSAAKSQFSDVSRFSGAISAHRM
jgi:hypothetical protein